MATKKTKTATSSGPPWTKAQRAVLSGIRHPHPLDPPAPPRSRKEAWEVLVRVANELDASMGPVQMSGDFHTGSAEKPTALYAPVAESFARNAPPETLDFVTEQIRAGALMRSTHTNPGPNEAAIALLSFWIETAGYDWLLQLARAPFLYQVGGWTSPSGSGRCFAGGDSADGCPNRNWGLLAGSHYLDSLRSYLFALPEQAYPSARDALLAAWERHPPPDNPYQDLSIEREWMAFLLAREGTRANELYAAKDGKFPMIHQNGKALASITDLALLTARVQEYPGGFMHTGALYALDLVELHGKNAEPLLDLILTAAAGSKPKLHAFYARRLEAAKKLASAY